MIFICGSCHVGGGKKDNKIRVYPACPKCNGHNIKDAPWLRKKTIIENRFYCNDCKKGFPSLISIKTPLPVEKRCKRCGTIKTIDEFSRDDRSKGGYRQICRRCMNPNKNYLKKYGLSTFGFDTIYAKQDGCCAICGTILNTNNSTRAHIDHDHKTGFVRGILCHACNKVLGFARDNVDILEKAIWYLKKTGKYLEMSNLILTFTAWRFG